MNPTILVGLAPSLLKPWHLISLIVARLAFLQRRVVIEPDAVVEPNQWFQRFHSLWLPSAPRPASALCDT